MTLIECCAIEGLTCIFGFIVLLKYYENDIKSYENNNNTSYTKDTKDIINHSPNDEKIHLLHIQEQPIILIRHNH